MTTEAGSSSDRICSMFESYRAEIDTDQDLKEEIRTLTRDLEGKGREMLTIMQRTHSINETKQSDNNHLNQVREILVRDVRPIYAKLAEKIPRNEYFRYHDHFRWVNQRMAFLLAFLHFLDKGELIARDDAAAQLGVAAKRSDGFHLDLEDYLCGLLQLASELARFAINSVAAGDNARPFQIATFLADVDAKFRLLNLKNDNLRKRFDALKYDVQKVEHVVYDLTIRGLKPTTAK